MGQIQSASTSEIINDLETINNSDYVIEISINNVLYKVTKDVPLDTPLVKFIRDQIHLKGTKAMCHEGGCGACIVTAERNGKIMAVNSCLIPLFICDGWKITTIEGIGNREMGYNILQTTLADMNGSQCGFCSPGWVMNMYSLTQNGDMTMKEIENSFASNICRCTGYRPILDAFKRFASDAPPMITEQIKDIEDLYILKKCTHCQKQTCNRMCQDLEIVHKSNIPRSFKSQSNTFFKVLDIESIFTIFVNNPNASYIINGGNTAHGVYRNEKKQIYIDVNDVPDLHRIDKEKDNLTLGANITLSTAKATFEKYMMEPGFEYLKSMVDHLDLVASIPIRNIGTIAGNLMIKHQHNEFPSDIFLMLEAIGAQVHLLDSPGSKTSVVLLEFLRSNMDKKLIYSIVLPAMSKEFIFRTYKIMPRAQNAHAIVNAGFLFKLDKDGRILTKPNIIFGGIRPDFFHASKTEEFLQGKSIFDVKILQSALKILDSELNPDHVLPDPSPEFRKLLAEGLFYKFVLNLNPDKIKPNLRSGGSFLQRELSSGKQDYDTDRNIWPVNQPILKIGAIYQTSGEAEYVGDIPIRSNEVFCALTIADRPGIIQNIEYEEALNIHGVLAFYTSKDIPGQNAFVSSIHKYILMADDELVFADKEITYAGQAYGMIVAISDDIAQYASTKVRLIYFSGCRRKPMITVQDVLANNDQTRIMKVVDNPAQQPAGNNTKYNIKGNHFSGQQYHFTMETQTCVCHPIEDGMDVFSATQFMDNTQTSVATVLNLPINSINIKVRRLGGGYGSKVTRSSQIACACALACHKLNRPARLIMPLEDNMRSIGKRISTYMEYEVNVDENGKIQQLDGTMYSNLGSSFNETNNFLTVNHFYNCYDKSTWAMIGKDVRTDVPSNTWCRAPGSTEGIAMIEHIMERIARVTGKDPLDVRMINIDETDKKDLVPMISELIKTSNYEERKKNVEKFNKENRWKKQGISLIPMKFPMLILKNYHSLVSIYARDGTVSITQAGIEMGQGLHTKIAQIAAYTLGIDFNLVTVKPSNCLTAPNSYATINSQCSDTCGYATQQACKELVRRLQPIKEMLGGNPSWQELVLTADANYVDLCASYMFTVNQDDIKPYPVYGVTVSEVEVDMLTGQHLIRRVDILEDTGISMNPKIDVGQVEGAFVMGIGYWTCEDLIYDPDTGSLTNYRTWNYKVPEAKDIPIDFRIAFRRNAPNQFGILGSKTTGEPPLCMSVSIAIALRQALNAARADAGNHDPWFQLDKSYSTERILLNSLTKIEDMVL